MDSNVKIIQQKENPLFQRQEVKIIVKANSNPSFSDAEKIISETFKTTPENIKILGINGKFGRDSFLITSNVYKTQEDKNKTEKKPKKKKEKK
jgi:ribosomal protein S24E